MLLRYIWKCGASLCCKNRIQIKSDYRVSYTSALAVFLRSTNNNSGSSGVSKLYKKSVVKRAVHGYTISTYVLHASDAILIHFAPKPKHQQKSSPMKIRYIPVFAVLLPFPQAYADVYQCDENGIQKFQSHPCEGGTKIKLQKVSKPKSILENIRAKSDAHVVYLDSVIKNMQQIRIGMPIKSFLALFPNPEDPLLAGQISINKSIKYNVTLLSVNRTRSSLGTREQWILDLGRTEYYYFENGILQTIQN